MILRPIQHHLSTHKKTSARKHGPTDNAPDSAVWFAIRYLLCGDFLDLACFGTAKPDNQHSGTMKTKEASCTDFFSPAS
jgi:hypothetical protein